MRNYRKCGDVVREMREWIRTQRLAGAEMLENERALAKRFHVGRPTVAKALRLLEEEGAVQCSKRGTRIASFHQKYRYVYVATVRKLNGAFWFLAYQQLWNELQNQIAGQQLRIDFLPFDPDEESDEKSLRSLFKKLAEYDVVFISLIGSFKPCDFPQRLKALGGRVFILDENIETEGFPLYALGNYQTGVFAAQCLLERGYRKTALIAPSINTASFDFRNRINGFAETYDRHEGNFELFSSSCSSFPEELDLFQRHIGALPVRGFDSIFFLDDKRIALCEHFIAAGMTSDFGILAFDGTMTSRRSIPPIDTISHATVPLAAKICSVIQEIESGIFRFDPSERIRLVPLYYRGKTLRDIGNIPGNGMPEK